MKVFLYPLSKLYEAVTTTRNFCYDTGIFYSYKSSLPVISIGNITAGGTGKTPLCIYIANKLREKNRKPVILSRGYKGRVFGPKLVESNDNYLDVGDEPLLLLRATGTPVVIAKNRVAGCKFIEENKLGDVIILDDGFQHRRLKRDLNIVTVDASTKISCIDFSRGEQLPLGMFRENRDRALKRADILMLSFRGPKPDKFLERELFEKLFPFKDKIFESYLEPKGVFNCGTNEKLDPQGIFAFCGIANPEPFFKTLNALGFKVKDKVIFSDHFKFSEKVLEGLRHRAGILPMVCTEKDAVKIAIGQKNGVSVLKTELLVDEEMKFIGFVADV